MSGRPRTSTLVISGLFLAVLALYLLVRPATPTTPADTNQSATNPSPTATTPAPTRTSPSPTRSPRPSHTVSPSATPVSTSPAPLGSPTTAPPTLGTSPSAGSPTP